MTLRDYFQTINNLVMNVKRNAIDEVIIPGANQVAGEVINRNVNKGENTDGSKRKPYSTKPAYYGKDKFVKAGFSPRGKDGSGRFSNGNTKKTMYFQDGYKGLRGNQGRRTDIKNYDYSGDTILAFGVGRADDGAEIGFRSEKASKIRRGLEEKNGIAFTPSAQEIQNYKKQVIPLLQELQIKGILGVS